MSKKREQLAPNDLKLIKISRSAYNINLKNYRYVCMIVYLCGTVYKAVGFVKNNSKFLKEDYNTNNSNFNMLFDK